jgi:hypothetical protein
VSSDGKVSYGNEQGKKPLNPPGGEEIRGEPPSGYIVNLCKTCNGKLRLLATYTPGVHPTGPFHKRRSLGYEKRVDHGVTVWKRFSSEAPDIVVVSSLLWDIARVSFFEPKVVAGPELSLPFLEQWADNYTKMVEYARAKLPKVSFRWDKMLLNTESME